MLLLKGHFPDTLFQQDFPHFRKYRTVGDMRQLEEPLVL